jgi:hypothetical protein
VIAGEHEWRIAARPLHMDGLRLVRFEQAHLTPPTSSESGSDTRTMPIASPSAKLSSARQSPSGFIDFTKPYMGAAHSAPHLIAALAPLALMIDFARQLSCYAPSVRVGGLS